MKTVQAVAKALVILTIAGSAAHAQTINFTTSGSFSGAGCSSIGATTGSVWCDVSVGGTRLTYNFQSLQTANGSGPVDFGSFQVSGSGSSTFSNVTFTMFVNQTLPAILTSSFAAPISGTTSAQQGGLLWAPVTPLNLFIGAVRYKLDLDIATNGININPAGAGGVAGSTTLIKGSVVTSVPEPSTYALTFAGIAAIAIASRRRRVTVG